MTGRKGFSREAEPKERGSQGSTFQTGRHSPSPNIPVPIGIPRSARTGAQEYSLDLWREKWEAGAASEATLPPPSAGDILGKELGPKGGGSVLGKTPAGIPLHTKLPKSGYPGRTGLCHPQLGLLTLSHWNCTKPRMGSKEMESKEKPTSRLAPMLQGFSGIKR